MANPTTRSDEVRGPRMPGETIPFVEILKGQISIDLPENDIGIFSLRWEVDPAASGAQPVRRLVEGVVANYRVKSLASAVTPPLQLPAKTRPGGSITSVGGAGRKRPPTGHWQSQSACVPAVCLGMVKKNPEVSLIFHQNIESPAWQRGARTGVSRRLANHADRVRVKA